MDKMFIKKLNSRYIIYQLLFFSICAGTSGFAMTYLLGKGFSASHAGTILACSSITSCIVQPLLGDVFDRLKRFVLHKIVAGIFVCAFLCFAAMQFLELSVLGIGILYGAGNLMLQVTNSLNNSICAYYTNHNCPINYGMGQGLGSMAFSFASLGYGYIIDALGISSIIWIIMFLIMLLIITAFGYPVIKGIDETFCGQKQKKEERVSLLEFFFKYKMFVFTMSGVLIVGMCHSMSESYFIKIFEYLGGGSEDVGIAFFVGCLSAVPFFVFFEKIQKRINVLWFLKTAGLFFMLKTLLIILSTEVWHIYLIQLLQSFTYGFIFQPLYYFARIYVSEADLVKGQAVAIAMYLTGNALGGFVGGHALDAFGLERMLLLALFFSFAGTIIINVSLMKRRNKNGN